MTTHRRYLCLLGCLWLACTQAKEQPAPKTPEPIPAIAWYSDAALAFADARERKMPLLMFIEVPSQNWSRLLLEKFSAPEIAELAKAFVPVRINMQGTSLVLEQLSIRIVPDLRVFDPEGAQLAHADGNLETAALLEFLKNAKSAKAAPGAPTLAALFPSNDLEELEKLASAGKLPDAAKLARLVKLAGDPPGESHTDAQRLLKALAPQLAAQLPAFLGAPNLKTRLSAFDTLAELEAPLASYDPWNGPATPELLAALNVWALPIAAAAAQNSSSHMASIYPRLSARARAQVDADLQELRGGGERRAAARQRLSGAGRGVVPVLREFARGVSANDPELALLCDEIRFGLLLDSETLRKRPTAPHTLAAAATGERAALLGTILSSKAAGLEALAREGLCDREPLVREVSVRNLASALADPNEALRDALKDADANVRVAALTAMAAKGAQGNDDDEPVQPKRTLKEWWGSGNKTGAAAPPPISNAQAIAEYLAKEPDADMIGHAVRALGAVDSSTSRTALRNLLHDPRWQVRAAAVTALTQLNDDASAPEFVTLAMGDDGFVAGQAVEGLTKLEKRNLDVAMLEKAVEKHPEVTLAVIKALGNHSQKGNKEVDRLLRKFTKNQLPEIRAQALLALASDKTRDAFDEVAGALADSAAVVRAAAAQGLRELIEEKDAENFADGSRKPPEAYAEVRPKLVALLKDHDESVQQQALQTLLFFGDWEKAWPELQSALRAPHEAQREAAYASLAHLPGERVLEAVRLCVKESKVSRSSDEWFSIALSAARSLHAKASLWPKNPPAMQAVFELLPKLKSDSLPSFFERLEQDALQSWYTFEDARDNKNSAALAEVLKEWTDKTPDAGHRHILKLEWLRSARLDDSALTPFTEDKDFETRRLAIAIVIRRENKGPAALVKKLVADPNAEMRCMGVIAAIPQAWRERLDKDPLTHDLIGGEELRVYARSNSSIDYTRIPKVVELPLETLEKLLKDDNEAVRVATAYLMSFEGGDQGLPELAQHIKSSERKPEAGVLLMRATIMAWSDEHTHFISEAYAAITADKRYSYELRQFAQPLKELKGELIKKLRPQLKMNPTDLNE